MLIKLFSSKVRIELLNAFYTFPDKELYLRELVRITGEDYKNISMELHNLETLDLISSRRDGNRKYFHLNQSFFLNDELKSIFYKTKGAVGLLRETLSGEKGIKAAFLFGSFASGTENAKSDIDLMVIGSISVDRVLKALRKPEKSLAREINATVYGVSEMKSRLKQKDSFIAQVLHDPKVMLVGTEDDLRRIAEQRCAKKSKSVSLPGQGAAGAG
jgi:predicted nucleotidyltransferase